MEDWNLKQMTPFDCQIASQSLQITKLMIPYLPPQAQRIMAVYVKYMEFLNTLSSFHIFRRKVYDAKDIIQDLRPYMPPSACDSIDNIQNMMSMMEMFQSYQETTGNESIFDPMAMMKDMLSSDQQNIFEMYNTIFDDNTNQTLKGGDNK